MGVNIKLAISGAILTLEYVAEKMDVSKAAVSKWQKTGKIGTHHIPGLAKLTNKPIEYFFQDGSGPEKTQTKPSFESLLSEHSDDAEFLEQILLDVLTAKLRANSKS